MAKQTQNQIVLARATKGLETQAAALGKIATDLQGLVATSVGVVQQIEDLTAQAAELEESNAAKRRAADAELKLRVKEDRDAVLAELLKQGKLANITSAELESLKGELAAKNASDDKELKTAVAIAVQAANRDAAANAAQVDATNKVNMAQKDATIMMQDEKIAFLQSQVVQLQGQIDADRSTRLAIAQAEAQRQGVVVNNGK